MRAAPPLYQLYNTTGQACKPAEHGEDDFHLHDNPHFVPARGAIPLRLSRARPPRSSQTSEV